MGTVNTFSSLQPLTKTVYGQEMPPTKTIRKKRFAKIRKIIEGK